MERRHQQEKGVTVDKPTIIIHQFLGDRHILKHLLPKEGNHIQHKAKRAVTSLNSNDSDVLAQKLITGMAKDKDELRLNAALHLFQHVVFEKVNHDKLTDIYVAAVQKQRTFRKHTELKLFYQVGAVIASTNLEANEEIKKSWEIFNAQKVKTRSKLSEAHKGKTHSPESRAKMSKQRQGKSKSPEHKKKISNSLKGKTFSPETRAKMSEAAKKRVRKPHSEETKAKIRETSKKRYRDKNS